MIPISDIPFPKGFQDERSRCDVVSYQADLVHYIRKKPTRAMRKVKKFLDCNLRDSNQDPIILERELSHLYVKFSEQQVARQKCREQRASTSLVKHRSLSKKRKVQDDPRDLTKFKEYKHYLDRYADENCNLFEETRRKPQVTTDTSINKETKFDRESMVSSAKPKQLSQRLSHPSSSEPYVASRIFSQPSGDKISRNTGEKFPKSLQRDPSIGISVLRGESQKDIKIETQTQGFHISQKADSMKVASTALISLISMDEKAINTEKSRTEIEGSINKIKGAPEKLPSILSNNAFTSLKENISRLSSKHKFTKKEIPFKFDKNFIASRKLQKRQIEYSLQKGLIPPSRLNVSFGY